MSLDKTAIRSMLQKKESNKNYLLQVSKIQITNPQKKIPISLRLSDGCHIARGLSVSVPELKDYDIVRVMVYRVMNLKGIDVLILEQIERVFTGLNELIGMPVDSVKVNPNEMTIDTTIPNKAKLLIIKASIPSVENEKVEQREEAIPKKKATRISLSNMKGIKPVKALGLHSNDWTIKVRLTTKGELRKFTRQKTGESYLIPLEFVDEEGTQISATLFSSGVDKYQSILKPLKCYLISNGNVRIANKRFTSIKNDYCVNLDAFSSIEEIDDDPAIPRSVYNFTQISKIAVLPTDSMIDIIGIVKGIGDITQFSRYDGTQTIRRTLRICDDTGHDIEMTLWGPKAENEYEEDGIYAFKMVKVKEYSGKQLNSNDSTVIIKDPDDPRTKELREWRKRAGEESEMISLTTKQVFNGDISLIAEAIKTADSLPVEPKGVLCWVSASIIAIQNEKGFYYIGCKKCKKKLVDSRCDKCDTDSEGVPYYNFTVKISDGTDSIWAHIFGDQGDIILGKTASELLNIQKAETGELRQIFEKSKGFVFFV